MSEFLTMVAVDRELNDLDPRRQHDLDALLARISRQPAQVVNLPGAPADKRPQRVGRFTSVARAASILCAITAGGWFLAGPGSWQTYSTSIGEQRAIDLSDGSRVNLNTASRIAVRLSADAREIRLSHGEALFTVAKESQRPFRVLASDTVVQAVGTQFNVRVRDNDLTVAVIEGRVRISGSEPTHAPRLLTAGEGAKVAAVGLVQPLATEKLQTATVWRERRLVFRDDTLEDIAAEFNRYNEAPRLRLASDAVRTRHYSGTFDADDPQSFAALLKREAELVLERRGNEIVIGMRN